MPVDQRVPGYLGRVLDADGTAIGTCFQVARGVLITAWHLLNDLDAGDEGTTVAVDALDGASGPAPAEVLRVNPVHDLAVLRRAEPLSASVSGISAMDVVTLGTEVVVTGVSLVDDPEHEYRFLDASGRWAGGTTRDDQVPLGRLSSTSVVRGMSGAPVRRCSDDVVVGVVSGRYNSADGWLRDSVWVARTEHLESLLAGVADVEVGGRAPLGGAVDLVLTRVGDRSVAARRWGGCDCRAPWGAAWAGGGDQRRAAGTDPGGWAARGAIRSGWPTATTSWDC